MRTMGTTATTIVNAPCSSLSPSPQALPPLHLCLHLPWSLFGGPFEHCANSLTAVLDIDNVASLHGLATNTAPIPAAPGPTLSATGLTAAAPRARTMAAAATAWCTSCNQVSHVVSLSCYHHTPQCCHHLASMLSSATLAAVTTTMGPPKPKTDSSATLTQHSTTACTCPCSMVKLVTWWWMVPMVVDGALPVAALCVLSTIVLCATH